MRKNIKRAAALLMAASMVLGSAMTSMAATAQDVINMNQASYTAGTSSVYGPSLTQDQLNQVAQAVANFTTNYINDSMDNDTKIRTAYDYLVNNVSYIDWNQGEGANAAFGALVRGQAACSGYARAFKALCDAMGVSCYYIHSTGNDHQWNMVEFNDGYYFVDVEANDSSGFEWIYHSATHPYPYDTTQFPAIGSHSGQSTSGTTTSSEGWQQDATGWWWRNADGSYPTSQWKEVNGKWYYFEGSGYMAANKWIDGIYYVGADGAMYVNTTTPDGYQVDVNGAWIQNAGQTQQNDGAHTKAMSDYDANLDMNFNVLEWRTDVNENQYILVGEDTTTFSFTGALSNINPQNLNVSMAAYKYSPENNTIYAFSQDGTAIYLPFEYDKVYDIQIPETNLTGSALVEYCKNNNIAIAINAFDITTNNSRGFIICYK